MTTVLVIDDDVGFAQGLAACLRARNYRTFVECNGDAALVTMADRPVDVVLCDIVMPGLLGPGFLQKAQSVPGQETLPVVFMSTLPEERVSRMFDGYAAYLRKPFSIPDVVGTIEGVLGRRRRGAPAVTSDARSPLPPLPPLHTASARGR
ncbi:MAG TPA: response regulator [Casimicrobiaceae bacterium]|nr:response regulator [Casimicrobiaceae bacterium]